jgi:nucleoside phosphorylase
VAAGLTGIIAALRREVMYLWGLGPGWRRDGSAWAGSINGREVLLLISGMGKSAALSATRTLLNHQPACVLSIGFAGALGDLPVGAVLGPAEVADESGAVLRLPSGSGRLLTMEAVAVGEKRAALRNMADAVDRESFAVVQECQRSGVPVRCLRAISDTPARDLPPDLAALFQGERISTLSLGAAVLRRPWRILDLIRLANDSREAARALAAAVGRALG